MRIYACGGDGTLNEAVNGAAGFANAAVTNVPKGTGNDFLKIFGADCRSRFSDLAALADGPQACFDLMDCNGKLGLDVVGFLSGLSRPTLVLTAVIAVLGVPAASVLLSVAIYKKKEF